MAFPLTYPVTSIPNNVDFQANTTNAEHTSPFTGQKQIYSFVGGQWWSLTLSYPPQLDSQARILSGFITALQGKRGTFTYKLPSQFLLASSVAITVAANGYDVTVNSGTATPGLFGTTNSNGLQRLVQFTTATTIFPCLPAGNYTINPSNGATMRLVDNMQNFSVNEMMVYGITIACEEAI
jgi:hypothetical protein